MRIREPHRGFTLMELLLSLGITAALIAILALAVGNLRGMAQRTSCTQQLRQLYTILLAYAQDHRGYLPRGGSGSKDDTGVHTWRGIWLRPQKAAAAPDIGVPFYAGGQDALDRLTVCPNNRLLNPPAPVDAYNPYGYPYVCNYELMTQNGSAEKTANLRQTDTSKSVLLIDGAFDSDWTGPGFIARSGWARFAERHGERLNILWADGRISSQRKQEIREQDVRRYSLP